MSEQRNSVPGFNESSYRRDDRANTPAEYRWPSGYARSVAELAAVRDRIVAEVDVDDWFGGEAA